MRLKSLSIAAIVSAAVLTVSCGKDNNDQARSADTSNTALLEARQVLSKLSPEQQAALASAPTVYEFERNGQSTVSFEGQIFRQLLIEDLTSFISKLQRGSFPGPASDVYNALDSYYSFSFDRELINGADINGDSMIAISTKDIDGKPLPIKEGDSYHAVLEVGKNLREKTAGIAHPLLYDSLKGWNSKSLQNQDIRSPLALLEDCFAQIAENAANGQAFRVDNGNLEKQHIVAAYITEDGLDLSQFIKNFLHTTLSFSQAVGNHLSTSKAGQGLLVDNEVPANAAVIYTALEQQWDKAFGYFGAARDYLDYSDKQIAEGYSIDSNRDKAISLHAEKNFGISIEAAKRDLAASDASVDLSREIMTAFLNGRHLISTKADAYQSLVNAYALIIADAWERCIAATVIHYLNKLSAEMDEYGSKNYHYSEHARYFSAMKGFALGIQFNPYSSVSVENFERFHSLIGDRPVLMNDDEAKIAAYKSAIREARQILRDIFAFPDKMVANW